MLSHKFHLACFITCLFGQTALSAQITVTTFNIEWYGQRFEQNRSDERDEKISEFLHLSGIDSDVMVFQEIIDVGALQRRVLDNRYRCISYDHNSSGHQHVALCHKLHFGFRVADDDDNYAYESVALGSLRPALHGILTDDAGQDLAHIVGVHLKAMPDQSSRRLQQTRILADLLNERNDELPLILLGDFNSFEDDIANMTEIFDRSGIDLKPINNPFDFTFRTNRYRNKLDWIWGTGNLEVARDMVVDGPCNDNSASGTEYEDLAYYNRNVSDHCPVSVKLSLPTSD